MAYINTNLDPAQSPYAAMFTNPGPQATPAAPQDLYDARSAMLGYDVANQFDYGGDVNMTYTNPYAPPIHDLSGGQELGPTVIPGVTPSAGVSQTPLMGVPTPTYLPGDENRMTAIERRDSSTAPSAWDEIMAHKTAPSSGQKFTQDMFNDAADGWVILPDGTGVPQGSSAHLAAMQNGDTVISNAEAMAQFYGNPDPSDPATMFAPDVSQQYLQSVYGPDWRSGYQPSAPPPSAPPPAAATAGPLRALQDASLRQALGDYLQPGHSKAVQHPEVLDFVKRLKALRNRRQGLSYDPAGSVPLITNGGI